MTVKKYAPAALVEFAATEKIDAGYDHVWCVCDVDDFDVTEAIRLAAVSGVGIALSQPCFEVWLILHKAECRRTFQNAKEVGRALEKLVPGWDKSNLRIEDFWDDIEDAIRRAKGLGEPPDSNPSSSVWKLMELLKIENRPPSAQH